MPIFELQEQKAPRGQSSVQIVARQRGENVTLCLAVSPILGVVHSSTFKGGMMQEMFRDFITNVAVILAYNDDSYILLCDNVRSHFNVPHFADQGDIKYLPKYSLFLNTTEMAGSTVKAAMKRYMLELKTQQIYDHEHRNGETLHTRRIRIVKREFERAFLSHTVKNCAAFMRPCHVLRATLYSRGKYVFK